MVAGETEMPTRATSPEFVDCRLLRRTNHRSCQRSSGTRDQLLRTLRRRSLDVRTVIGEFMARRIDRAQVESRG